MSAEDIVNAAKLAWKIFEDGAPSGDIAASTASAVPDVTDKFSLSGTRGPMSLRLYWSRMAAWPWDDYIVADITILLKWEYGATYRGGGLFIPNL